MGTDGIVHVVHVAAVGAGDLLDAARFGRVRIAEQIKFELFAALASFDVHVQRTGHDLAQIAEEHAESSLLQLHIAEALHLAAAGGAGFLAHKRLPSVRNALCSLRAEGEYSRYHLWFAAFSQRQPHGVLTHSRAITGAPGARLLEESSFGRRLRGVFGRLPSPSSTKRRFSLQGMRAYFSASSP